MTTLTKLTNYMETLHKFEVRGYEVTEVRSYVIKAIDAYLEGKKKLANFQVKKAEEIKIELRPDVALALELEAQKEKEAVPVPMYY